MGALSGKPNHAPLDKIVGSSSLILMENRRFFGLFLLLLIFLMASEERVVVARTCESQSFGFKGGCWSTHNCALVCLNENFTGGKCKGFRHRCFCTKPCDA